MLITADDKYYFYLNGIKITNTKSDWKTVDKYPVTLVDGKNLIAVWSKDEGRDEGVLVEVWHDGQLIDNSNSSWKSLHANNPPTNWANLAYDDGRWVSSRNTRNSDDKAEAKLDGQSVFSDETQWMWCDSTNDDEECRFRKEFNIGSSGAAVGIEESSWGDSEGNSTSGSSNGTTSGNP